MKNVYLALCFVLLLLTTGAYAQNYNGTFPLTCATTAGGSVAVPFNATIPAGGDGTVTFTYSGDLDLSTEYIEFYDESGTLLGTGNTSGQCTSTGVTSFTIPQADINSWIANGSIDFLVQGSSSVSVLSNCPCASASFGVEATLTYPLSGIGVNNAGVTTFNSPTLPACSGTYPVSVTIMNLGTNQINPVTVGWSIDGIAQTSTTYTSTLDTLGGSGNMSATVSLGNITITGPTTLKAWTSNPNNVADTANGNDTVLLDIVPALDGIYTIGGTGADYPSFTAAVNDLNTFGVCGPVTFHVNDGTYNEQIMLTTANGMSATNTVTFKSNPSNTNLAEMVYGATGTADNYVIQFNDASYFTIDSLELTASGSSYARVIDFPGTADQNTIRNCAINGISTTSTSTNVAVIYNASGTGSMTENTLFENNTITGGGYQTYWYGGSSSVHETGNAFIGNTCTGFYYYGIRMAYQDGIIYDNNIVTSTNPSYSTTYGVYVYYCDGETRVRGNHITNYGNTATGIYVYYSDATSGNPGIFANNFVSMANENASGLLRGIYHYYSYYQNYYHNNIHIVAGSSSTEGVRMYNYSGNVFKNNVVSVLGNGAAAIYLFGTAGTSITSDYNAYHYPNGTLGYAFGGTYATLSAYQSSSTQDANSIEVDPLYTSNTDLHVAQVALNATADPVGITVDIDGDVRAVTPDIGADEFIVPNYDAAAFALVSPVNPACGDSSVVEIVIINGGILALTSATIAWEINGVMQTPQLWTGNLAPAGMDTVVVGNIAINDGDFLEIWTESPNGVPDSNFVLDTLTTTIYEGLEGTYGIGASASADYPDFTSAVADLHARGICGAVVFEAESGTYTEQIEIGQVFGVNATNTVTFRSAAMDSSMVTLQFNSSSSSDNYVVRMMEADYYTFEHLTLKNTGSSYGYVIELAGGNDSNTFQNCVIENSVGSTSSNGALVYSGSGTMDHNNHFLNNRFQGGSYGLYLYATSTSEKEEGTMIIGNEFFDQYYRGVYLYYHNTPIFSRNTMTSNASYASAYGLYAYYCDAIEISYNKIYPVTETSDWPYIGMYTSNSNGTLSQPTRVYNNLVTTYDASSTTYGYYMYYTDLAYVSNNNFTILDGGTASRAFYPYYSDNYAAQNNLFTNFGSGYAAYFYYGSGYEIDHNNYYSLGTEEVYVDGTSYGTFEDFQNALGVEENGLSVHPNFGGTPIVNDTINGLLCNDSLDGAGSPYAWLTDDYYGTARDVNNPDIGAVEFSGLSYFTLGEDFTACGTETELSVTGGENVGVTWFDAQGQAVWVSPTFTIDSEDAMPISVEYTNGCGTAVDTISVAFVEDIDLSDAHMCANQTTTLEGDGSGQYTWSTGETTSMITVTTPGTYSVTYTEDGCTSMDVAEVTQSVELVLMDMTHCGTTAQLDATIPYGMSYTWSSGQSTPTINVSQSGQYSVTVMDSFSCATVSSMELTMITGDPSPDFTETHSYLTYIFDAGPSDNVGPGSVYHWDFEGDGITDFTANYPDTTAIHSYPFSGEGVDYNVVLEIVNTNCPGSPANFVEKNVHASLSVQDLSQVEGKLEVYPNPSGGTSIVKLPKNVDRGSLRVLDLTGRQVLVQQVSISNNTLDLTMLASGTYNIVLVSDTAIFTEKVVLK